jgi:hypothetical protein
VLLAQVTFRTQPFGHLLYTETRGAARVQVHLNFLPDIGQIDLVDEELAKLKMEVTNEAVGAG